jgi:hypothetical protein
LENVVEAARRTVRRTSELSQAAGWITVGLLEGLASLEWWNSVHVADKPTEVKYLVKDGRMVALWPFRDTMMRDPATGEPSLMALYGYQSCLCLREVGQEEAARLVREDGHRLVLLLEAHVPDWYEGHEWSEIIRELDVAAAAETGPSSPLERWERRGRHADEEPVLSGPGINHPGARRSGDVIHVN